MFNQISKPFNKKNREVYLSQIEIKLKSKHFIQKFKLLKK